MSIFKVIYYIEQNYNDNWTREKLSKVAVFSKAFKNRLWITPKEFSKIQKNKRGVKDNSKKRLK
jgi:AraC-like DNA-binding protein